MLIRVPLPTAYRFDAMIDAHGWPQLLPFRWIEEQHVLERVEQLSDGQVVVLHISAVGPMLNIEVAGPDLDAAQQAEVEHAVRWMVELDVGFAEFYAFCADHSALHHVQERGLGPMLRGSTVWEDYVKTVCTTNTTWAQTKGLVARIVGSYGAPLPADDRRTFSTPEAIAAAAPDDFAAIARAGYRAPYLHTTALAIAEGRLDLEQYKQRAQELEGMTLMRELRALRGIGPYGAAHLALLLGSYSAIPSDSWARDLVRHHFNGGAPVSDADVHRHFAPFGRWQALAFRCWDWVDM